MLLPKLPLLLVAAFVTLSLLGCDDHSTNVNTGDENLERVMVMGSGQKVTVMHSDVYDLEVAGDDNTVTVTSGSNIRLLAVSGVDHEIVIMPGSSVRWIRLTGVGTTIHLPADVHPAIHGNGSNNVILNDENESFKPEPLCEASDSESCQGFRGTSLPA